MAGEQLDFDASAYNALGNRSNANYPTCRTMLSYVYCRGDPSPFVRPECEALAALAGRISASGRPTKPNIDGTFNCSHPSIVGATLAVALEAARRTIAE
jgi:hypothetical protein